MELTFRKLEVNRDALERGLTPEIYATDAALELVAGGMSFRDAYREVGLNLEVLENRDPRKINATRTSTGTAGNPGFDRVRKEKEALMSLVSAETQKLEEAVNSLLGTEVDLLAGNGRF